MRKGSVKKGLLASLLCVSLWSVLGFTKNTMQLPIYIVDQKGIPMVRILEESEGYNEVEEGWIEVEVKREEDLANLEKICKEQGNKASIRVKDYIRKTYGQEPIKALNLFDLFYGDLPLKYQGVKEVIIMGEVKGSDPKVSKKYQDILIKPYLKVEKNQVMTQEQFTLVVPVPPKKGQYVEYKVNEQLVGQASRYPYVFSVEPSFLHEGVNQIRVIVHNQETKDPQIETFYIKNITPATSEVRASRTTKSYDLSSKVVYDTPYIPVLMYHKILKVVGEEEQSIAVSVKLFEQHIQRLQKEGYTPIHFKDLYDHLKGTKGMPKKPVIITSDDGYLCNYEQAYPILEKYSVPATFFVSTEHMGSQSYNDHFNWEQAKEMEASGLIDIQSHSHRHKPMDQLSEVEVYYELNASFALIEKYLGKRDVQVLAFPQFRRTNKVQEWVKQCGIEMQVTDLVKKPVATILGEVKRIHISNEISTDELIRLIEEVTQIKKK